MKPLSLRLVAVPTALAAVAAARAYVFTIDNPNLVVTRPASGSVTYDFTGTVATGSNEYLYSYGDYAAFDAAGDSLIPEAVDSAFFGLINPNSTYSGTLFRLTIDSTTPLGVYDQIPGLTLKPYLDVAYWTNGVGGPHEEVDLPYTVTVQAVPEPASCAALSLAALTLLRHRRTGRPAS